jgi:hypothetical protein
MEKPVVLFVVLVEIYGTLILITPLAICSKMNIED